MPTRPVVVITDCRDDNAEMRQSIRIRRALHECDPPTFVGVQNDYEAAIQLLDALHELQGLNNAVVLVNVAPRDASSEKYENGSPFCFFFVGKVLVVSTIAGHTLSLVKKFIPEVKMLYQLNIRDVLSSVHASCLPEQIELAATTQFRSLEAVPIMASAILTHQSLPRNTRGKFPAIPLYINETVPDIGYARILLEDSFGNRKLGDTAETFGYEEGRELVVQGIGNVICIPHLRDVPEYKWAFTQGSSGYGDHKLIELVRKGCSERPMNWEFKTGDQIKVTEVEEAAV